MKLVLWSHPFSSFCMKALVALYETGVPFEARLVDFGDPTSAGPREFRIAAELGFKTAVTTRPGVVFKAHREHLTALPRISVNGDYQNQRHLKVLMSGAATAMWNGFKRVNAA